MKKNILTIAAVLGAVVMFSSCDKDTEKDVTILAKDEVNVSALAGKIVTISFEADGFGIAANPATVSVANGSKITLPAPIVDENSENAKLFEFKGWAESADGEVKYEAGKEYEVAGNAVLYAVWQLKPFEQLKKDEVFKDKLLDFLATAKELYNGDPFNLTIPDTAFANSFAEDEFFSDLMTAIAETQAKVILDLSKTNLTNYSDNFYWNDPDRVSYYPNIYGLTLPESTRGIMIKNAYFKSLNIPKYVTSVDLYGESFSTVTFAEGSKCKKVSIVGGAVESIELPSSVETFKASACLNLKSLDASNVKDCKFELCPSLSSLTLGVELLNLNIYGCSALESLTILDPLEQTSNINFSVSNCPSLKSVSIPGNVNIEVFEAPLMALSSIEIRTSSKVTQLPLIADPDKIVVAPLGTYDQEKEELFFDHGMTVSFVNNGKKIEKLSDFNKLGNNANWSSLIKELTGYLPQVESKNDKGEVIKDDDGKPVMRNQTFEDVTGIKDDTASTEPEP